MNVGKKNKLIKVKMEICKNDIALGILLIVFENKFQT